MFAAASGLGLSGIIVCCRKLGNEVPMFACYGAFGMGILGIFYNTKGFAIKDSVCAYQDLGHIELSSFICTIKRSYLGPYG